MIFDIFFEFISNLNYLQKKCQLTNSIQTIYLKIELNVFKL